MLSLKQIDDKYTALIPLSQTNKISAIKVKRRHLRGIHLQNINSN